jgi:UPF0042 nucleotide-binding protein
MRLLIVTGMSGAGKSKVVDALEDIGWFCADNLPPRLAPTFLKLLQEAGGYGRAAIVMDLRAGDLFRDVPWALENMRGEGFACELLFLDAADEVLERRFKETRRQHPLCAGDPALDLAGAIAAERERLGALRQQAGILLDTSRMSPADCRNRIVELYADRPQEAMHVRVTSFGFKAGTPRDCDLLFDVRCLPNPFYVPELKERTGREACIRDWVLGYGESRALLGKINDLLLFLLPLYQKEGKSALTIAFGCTGGKHRSVLFAEEAGRALKEAGFAVNVGHRDI